MKVEIKIPALGESISQATISRIITPSGSLVQRDQEIVEIETDKVNQLLYAPESGKLELKITARQTVKIGEVIGSVDTAAAAPKTPSAPAPPSSQPVRITPRETVTTFSKTPQPPTLPPSTEQRRPMSSLRRTIAQRLVEVKNKTAMLTSFAEADMTHVMEIRTREKENFQKKYGVKLGLMSFFVKASVFALKQFPDVHAFIDREEIVQFSNYDIGVAVSTDKGLMVPVIRGCDTASFGQIEKQIGEYAEKARTAAIALTDLQGGSFTITNGGVFGSLLSTPILNPPQSGILGMHAIVKRPVAIDDKVVIRPMMYLAFSYDHRIIDGKEAVQFLLHIKQSLEDPSRLLLEL